MEKWREGVISKLNGSYHYYVNNTQRICLFSRYGFSDKIEKIETHFFKDFTLVELYDKGKDMSDGELLVVLTKYFTQENIRIIPLLNTCLKDKSTVSLPLRRNRDEIRDNIGAILYSFSTGNLARVESVKEKKLDKLPEKYYIRNKGYDKPDHFLHAVWKMYIKKHVPSSNGVSQGSYYTNDNKCTNKPENYVEISLEDWNRLSNLVVKAEDKLEPALTELPKQYAIQYRPGSFSEKEKILWRKYVDFVNLKAMIKIEGDRPGVFYYNNGDNRRLSDLHFDCTIITLDVWDRLRPKEPTIKQVLNIHTELSAEEFLSLSEKDKLTHLEWKYPPGTKCVSRHRGEAFFASKNPVKKYHSIRPEYGRVGDLTYLFYDGDFIEKIPQENVLVKKSTPTKKDLSSIKTKEGAYDYLISIGVKPGMKYCNKYDQSNKVIPENFLNKKEILFYNKVSGNLDPGYQKGFFLWTTDRGFLTDFDDIDMYGNPKTQKANGEKPIIHVMEEASIDKSLIPEMEIKAKPLTKNEAFGLRYGTATFDKLEKVSSKEEIGIKKFNVPKI